MISKHLKYGYICCLCSASVLRKLIKFSIFLFCTLFRFRRNSNFYLWFNTEQSKKVYVSTVTLNSQNLQIKPHTYDINFSNHGICQTVYVYWTI